MHPAGKSDFNSEKSFHFTDEENIVEVSCSSSEETDCQSDVHICGENCLNIKVKEVVHPDFGMHVWPCAPVLGKFMWSYKSKLRGKTVLDLGAGTGIISIIAAKCGAYVILTDSNKFHSTFSVAEENMMVNNIGKDGYEIMELTWGHFSPNLINIRGIDFILGSDVFYDSKDFESIIVTVAFILNRNSKAEFWCSYEQRCCEWNIDYLLIKWNLTCEEIPLEQFGADVFNVAGHDMPGVKSISLFAFRLKM